MNDQLRQAIADTLWDLFEDTPTALEWGDAVLAAVLADPTIRRSLAIAEAVDNEPLIRPQALGGGGYRSGYRDGERVGHNATIAALRAAGEPS